MRNLGWGLGVATALVLAIGPAAAEDREIVKLTVEEESGVNRTAEPMTMGVPFPKGLVTDLGKVALVDEAGTAVPCQLSEVCKWIGSPSVRWAHLTVPVTVEATGKRILRLVLRDAAAPAPKTALVATVKGNVATVVTGPVKFVVRGARFNGFDKAWFDPTGDGNFTDPNKVLDAGDGGGAVVEGDRKVFSSLNDPDGKVEIEREGPMEVVVKATGTHKVGNGKRFDYIVRFYAYANSPIVRVSHTFVSRQGTKPADVLTMSSLRLDLPTALSGGTVAIGGEKAPYAAGTAGKVLQTDSDKYVVTSGDRQLGTGKGKSTKPLTTGWISLSKGSLGVAVGVKWFWQMYPKGLEVDDKGVLRVHMYEVVADPDAQPWVKVPWDVYMGQSRTHYLTVKFHAGESPKALNDFFAGTQRPLMAWAPGKYYLRDTHAFGYAAESDPKLFGGNKWETVKAYDAKLEDSINQITKKLDGHTYGLTRDSYGFYTWGDTFHWGSWPGFQKSPKKTPEWMLSYAGNYYDFPNAALMQFLRTGNKTFLRRFIPNAIHVGDVFTCHYHPRKDLWGACRYCPPRNHVAVDNGAPYVSVEFNHNKSQCVFNLYYLTGDLRTLDNARLLANNAYANHDADSGWAARGIGHQLAALWCAYELTGEKKYLDRMKGLAYRAMAQWRRGRYRRGGFHDGIANEGLVYYYWVSRDPKVIEDLKTGIDKKGDKAGRYTNMALGNAMVYAVTKDQKYAELAWKAFGRGRVSSRPKSFGLAWRNTPFALYFLATDLAECNRDAPPAP